jgi:hypothetical protein
MSTVGMATTQMLAVRDADAGVRFIAARAGLCACRCRTRGCCASASWRFWAQEGAEPLD